MVQGGLADDFLQSINAERATLYDSIGPKIDQLMGAVVVETLGFLIDLLQAIQFCRRQVTDALENEIHDETVMTLVTESLDDLDVVSSTHSVDTVDVLSTKIVSLDEDTVQFHIEGKVGIDFHWGSSSDGIDGSETFPFQLTMWSFVDDLQQIHDPQLMVDADFWHAQFGPDTDC